MTNIGILSEEKIITLKSNSNIVIEKIKQNGCCNLEGFTVSF